MVLAGAVMTAENTSRSSCLDAGSLGSAVGAAAKNLYRISCGMSVASSGTLRYVAMRVGGRKPHSAANGVIASAISGLWFGSMKPQGQEPWHGGPGLPL